MACVSVSSEMHAPGNWHLDRTSVAVLASILNGVSAGDVSACCLFAGLCVFFVRRLVVCVALGDPGNF